MKSLKTITLIISYTILIAALTAFGYGIYFMFDSNHSLAIILLLVLYFTSLIFTIALFVQTRHNAAKISWVIILAIIPVLGHLIFLFFGRRYSKRKELNVYRQKQTFTFERLDQKASKFIEDESVSEIFQKQSSMSARGIYPADFEIYNRGNKAFEELFKDIKSAKKFIHLHYYIVKPGEIFEQFKSLLIEKASQGVEIRMIIDDFGRWALPWHMIKELKDHGIQISIFGKVRFPFIGSKNGYRTHRKMAIIDGKSIHFGGLNIGDEYANLSKRYGLWLDAQTKMTGKAVRSHSLLFIDDWKMLTDIQLNPAMYLLEGSGGSSTSVLVEDSPEVKTAVLKNSLLSWIYSAKKSITISTPYFIPTNEIIVALKTASLSGVDVKIYIPGKPDKKTVLVASHYWAYELMKFGVKFYKTNDILLHSKIGVFDGKYGYVGSANIDMRSLYSQFEALSLVAGPVVNELISVFKHYDQLSTPLAMESVKTNKITSRILRLYANIFSPIM